MKRMIASAVCLIVVVLTAFTGCGKKKSAPQGEFAMLNTGNVELEMGQTQDVDVMEYDGKVTWKSSNNNVATVSEDGVITAVATGSSVVTATLESGTELNCTVSVVAGESNAETIKVTGIYSSASDITISYTESPSIQLKATCEPYDPNEKLMWSSDDEGKAKVDSNGLVSLMGNGVVTIKATAYNGVEGSCILRIKNVPGDVKPNSESGEDESAEIPNIEDNKKTDLSQSTSKFTAPVPKTPETAKSTVVVSDRYLYLDVAEGYKLTYAVGNSESAECEWMSSDKSVAIVNEDGYVVGLSAGRATVSVVAQDGATAHCEVAVGNAAIKKLKEEQK